MRLLFVHCWRHNTQHAQNTFGPDVSSVGLSQPPQHSAKWHVVVHRSESTTKKLSPVEGFRSTGQVMLDARRLSTMQSEMHIGAGACSAQIAGVDGNVVCHLSGPFPSVQVSADSPAQGLSP